ncbi:MAG TPA: hypothetical protein VIA18_23415 [Polyangia bacterium]|jgi:hypothetical protein|nr:hypothetical protein [Polyangia bacterium]
MAAPASAVRRRSAFVAAAAPPLLWMAQGALGWLVVAHACPPNDAPLTLVQARALVLGITLVALAASVAGLSFAWRTWSATTSDTATRERLRFVALAGTLICVTVTLGLGLAGLPMLLLRACGETR